jgi:hypothetical protein
MTSDLIQLTHQHAIFQEWVQSAVHDENGCTFVLALTLFDEVLEGRINLSFSGDEARLAWENWAGQTTWMVSTVPDDILRKLMCLREIA